MARVERIGVSLEKNLLSKFDKLIAKQGKSGKADTYSLKQAKPGEICAKSVC